MAKKNGKKWYALKQAWKGYRIARIKGETKKMEHYSEGILRIRKELGLKGKAVPVPKRLPKYVNGVMYKKEGKIVIGGIIKTL